MNRYTLIALFATTLAACARVSPSESSSTTGSGGDGGSAGSGGATSSAASTGGAGGSAPAVCFLNADCSTDWIPAGCHTVHCDPTGKDTAPGAPLLGCYLLTSAVSAPCQMPDGGIGMCDPTDNGMNACGPMLRSPMGW